MDASTVTSGISQALTDVGTIFTNAVSMVTGNPIAMVFIGFGLVSGGVALFRKIRH